jgi:hypothetical protein
MNRQRRLFDHDRATLEFASRSKRSLAIVLFLCCARTANAAIDGPFPAHADEHLLLAGGHLIRIRLQNDMPAELVALQVRTKLELSDPPIRDRQIRRTLDPHDPDPAPERLIRATLDRR